MLAARVLVVVALLVGSVTRAAAENPDNVKKRIQRFRKNAEWVEPLEYVNNVSAVFFKRLQEYGVGNLPIPNMVQEVNVTRYNIPLNGRLEFTDGFVANIMNVTYNPREAMWFIDDKGASVNFKLLLANVSVFYNLRADLEDSDTKVRAVLTFPASYIQVHVTLDAMTHRVQTKAMAASSVIAPKTKLTPDSSVMKAVGYNIRLTMANSLFGDLKIWIDNTLQSLMEHVVRDLSFPIRIRRVKRKPVLRALGTRRRRRLL